MSAPRYTRRGALAVARRAHKAGVPLRISYYIAFAARKHKVRWALAYALFEQESNFQKIYGHDAGGLSPGLLVTKKNYRVFRSYVVARRGGGANGVGLGQVTYWTYIRDHRGLWKPRVQVYLATSIFADYVHYLGEREGAGAYNGGPSTPNWDYAEDVLDKAIRWRAHLAPRRKK